MSSDPEGSGDLQVSVEQFRARALEAGEKVRRATNDLDTAKTKSRRFHKDGVRYLREAYHAESEAGKTRVAGDEAKAKAILAHRKELLKSSDASFKEADRQDVLAAHLSRLAYRNRETSRRLALVIRSLDPDADVAEFFDP